MGSHIAMTRPDMTVGLGFSTKALPVRVFQVVLMRSIQEPPAGLQMCGFSLPSRTFCIDSPDFMWMSLTLIGLSPTEALLASKARATSSIHSFLPSEEDTTISTAGPEGFLSSAWPEPATLGRAAG